MQLAPYPDLGAFSDYLELVMQVTSVCIRMSPDFQLSRCVICAYKRACVLMYVSTCL